VIEVQEANPAGLRRGLGRQPLHRLNDRRMRDLAKVATRQLAAVVPGAVEVGDVDTLQQPAEDPFLRIPGIDIRAEEHTAARPMDPKRDRVRKLIAVRDFDRFELEPRQHLEARSRPLLTQLDLPETQHLLPGGIPGEELRHGRP
jgi:hypothetical protein